MIKKKIITALVIISILTVNIRAQFYFPPNDSDNWDTLLPSSLGWCSDKIDSLHKFLEANNTKAFILLKDGKIVLEKYFDDHTADKNWYWASAGKTLTAFTVGIAQQEKLLNIMDTTSKYLGEGWTGCTVEQEKRITIWHQLTMTSGLDDGVSDSFCTIDSCLQFKADAGSRWAYHNAPYTLLDKVIEAATGETMNVYTNDKIKKATGMNGLYLKQGYNNVYYSTARSMARFGLLILNKGNWNGNQILSDSTYINSMVNTSQNLNESYGYLWWLNGKINYMIPQSQFVFSGSMNKSAPNDLIAALGKNGQFINVVPSQNLVWIRMGDAPGNSLVPFTFNDDIWVYLNDLDCGLSIEGGKRSSPDVKLYPNPVRDFIRLEINNEESTRYQYMIVSQLGQTFQQGTIMEYKSEIKFSTIPTGMYLLVLKSDDYLQTFRIFKE
ncbi:MAG: serine hydrolase [Bacteroidales bacterium]|nr:serine hydrolase [Bacteroidales bacterium]